MSVNVPQSSECSCNVPDTGGNSKALFLQLRGEKNTPVPSCSPFSSIKEDINNSGNMGKIEKENNINNVYIYNIGGGTGNTGTNSPTPTDPRFRSQSFRDAVRIVLQSLGEPTTFGKFKEWDGIVNWTTLAKNLTSSKTTYLTKCPIRGDYRGEVLIEIKADTEDRAVEMLISRGYKFSGWLSEAEINREIKNKAGVTYCKSLPGNDVFVVCC